MMDTDIVKLAEAVYSEVYGNIDSKAHKAELMSDIYDWLMAGDQAQGRTVADLAAEWQETLEY